MKFQIDRFCLDVNNRALMSEDGVQSIRPKTLTFMLYLIEHQAEIVSKEQLLNDIWDDVTVNEGVIFQSVREIRLLFTDIVVIQNHPRKGYQWVTKVTKVNDSADRQTPAAMFSHRQLLIAKIASLILAIAIVWFQLLPTPAKPQIVILPLHSQVDRNDHQWLEIKGAKQLRDLLADNMPEYLVTSVNIQSSEHEDNDTSDTTLPWRLSAAIYGDVYDYKLVYTITNKQQKYQGVIFTRTIQRAFKLLVDVSSINIQQTEPDVSSFFPDVVQNSALAQAMVAYETDWDTAISYLERYQQQHQKSVIAKLYLSRLYIWNSKGKQARQSIKDAFALKPLNEQIQAELLFNLALINQRLQPERALMIIDQGISLSGQPAAWLTRAKLEELRADIHYQQNYLVSALRGYLRAQSFYDQIQSPVNIAGIKLKLAALYIGNHDLPMAKQTFQKAKTMIHKQEMSFLYAALMEFEMQHRAILTD